MAEVWKAVPGWEGQYEVSNRGRVRSLDRILADGRRWSGKILKQQLASCGYMHVTLGWSGTSRVHMMVLYAFRGPPPDPSMESLHHDGNKTNNLLRNLRWGTRSENYADRVRHGTSNSKRDRLRANNTKRQT
jgi:hypothetical protein